MRLSVVTSLVFQGEVVDVWPPEPGFPHGRPRLDKVKTGEGGNAYGHGWYSAQAEEVARAYESAGNAFRIDGMSVEDFIAAKPPVTNFFEAAQYLKTDAVTASKWLAEDEGMIERRVAGYIQTYGENADFMIRSALNRGKPVDAELRKIQEMIESGRIEKSANIYKLEFPDDVIPSLLDWDKPLSEQSPK